MSEKPMAVGRRMSLRLKGVRGEDAAYVREVRACSYILTKECG